MGGGLSFIPDGPRGRDELVELHEAVAARERREQPVELGVAHAQAEQREEPPELGRVELAALVLVDGPKSVPQLRERVLEQLLQQRDRVRRAREPRRVGPRARRARGARVASRRGRETHASLLPFLMSAMRRPVPWRSTSTNGVAFISLTRPWCFALVQRTYESQPASVR